jgi:putative membrane protein insertion efficiency factor
LNVLVTAAAGLIRALSSLLVSLLSGAIGAYQATLGRLMPDRCRFHPTCSTYAVRAIRLNGPVLGLAQAAWRLLRCGPWSSGGIDEPARIRVLRRPTKPDIGNSMMGEHG